MAVTKDQVLDFLKNMSVIELADFVKELEDVFGVSASAPAVAMAMAPSSAPAAEAAEKTDFDVVLTAGGQQKVQVIKVVRELTGLGLKEAKALVDEAPKAIKTAIPRAEAEEAVKKITEVGGSAEIK